MDEVNVQEVIEKHQSEPRFLVAMMQDVQEKYNYLPHNILEELCQKLDVPFSRAYALATFYKAFSLEPRGEYPIKVCMGTACHVRGASRIVEKIERELSIKNGETAPDLLFSLEDVRCLGCCGLAPVITVGEDLYGKVTQTSIPKILKKYKKAE